MNAVTFIVVTNQIIKPLEHNSEAGTISINFEGLLENIPAVLYRCACDDNWTMHFISKGITELTGYPAGEFIGNRVRSFQSVIHHDDTDAVDKAVEVAVETRSPWNVEYRVVARDGTIKWVSERGVGVFGETGTLDYLDGFIINISERKKVEHALIKSEKRVRELAFFDSVTGLANRNLFHDKLKKQLAKAHRDSGFALLFVDLDGFKAVNDNFGHRHGDDVLKTVAERLKSVAGSGTTVARFGGDEFLILASKAGTKDLASLVAEKIIRRLQQPCFVGDQEVYVTGSVGISLYPAHGTKADQLIKYADSAMYEAKALGKNRFMVHDESAEQSLSNNRLTIENSFNESIDRQEISLTYQPVVDLASGAIVSFEALLRWNHPELGSIDPGDFTPIAEDCGAIIAIGEWVLGEVCARCKELHNDGLSEATISCNVSPQQLDIPGFVNSVIDALKQNQLSPEYLHLEVNETALAQAGSSSLLVETIAELRAMGVQITCDSFGGNGGNTLEAINACRFDLVKVHRSMFTDSRAQENSSALRAISDISRSLDVPVVGVGVEDAETVQLLQDFRFQCAQGYFFSAPKQWSDIDRSANYLDLLQ